MAHQKLWVRYGIKTLVSYVVSATAGGLTYYTVGKYLSSRISMVHNSRKDLDLPSSEYVQ
jgi:hypothetical protein